MTTDKTPATLATAKHGGCVQLPTSERVKFDAWLEARSVDTTRWGDGEYTDPAAHNYWLAWQAALSAQPSPASSFDLEAMLAACVPGGSIVDPQVIADNIRQWFAAQPSPRGQGDVLLRKAIADVVAESRTVAHVAAMGNQTGDAQRCLDAARGRLEAALAARQPVGEPVAWVPAKFFDKGIVAMTARRTPPSAMAVELHGKYVPLFDAPPAQQPAQAVGLGAAIKAAFPLLTDYGLHHSQCCAYKLIDERHRLHNFIDIQAVGNG